MALRAVFRLFVILGVLLAGAGARAGDWLPPTAELKTIGGFSYVTQNGLVYGSHALGLSGTLYIKPLDGEWRKKRTAMDHALSLTRRRADVLERLEQGGEHAPGFDDSAWATATLPAVENMPPDKYVDGVWFRRSFQIPEEFKGSRVRLVFLGANYLTDVWINGRWVGWHEGGFTSFQFDASDFLKFGQENTIAVRVDNIPWIDEKGPLAEPSGLIVPYANCDWWNYGGIYRDVYLVADEPYGLEDIRISAPWDGDGGGRVTADLLIRTAGPDMDLRFDAQVTHTLEHFDEKYAAHSHYDFYRKYEGPFFAVKRNLAPESIVSEQQPDGSTLHAVRLSLDAWDVAPWSPESPQLYRLDLRIRTPDNPLDPMDSGVPDHEPFGRITLSQSPGEPVFFDSIRVLHFNFGFRSIAVDGRGQRLVLNGAPLLLKGANRHEELPDAGRAAARDPMDAFCGFLCKSPMWRDLWMIKDLGVNFVRTAHYPNHPDLFGFTDRIGLLASEEIPVYWFNEEGFRIQRERGIARQMWLEMIARDRNRPSIAFWSMGNETMGGEQGVKFFEELMEDARRLDGTRLVYHNMRGATLWDPTLAVGDILALSFYFGVFDKEDPHDGTVRALKFLRRRFPDKPVLAAEFGVWTWGEGAGEERQVQIFEQTWGALEACPFAAGAAWWAAFDYHSVRQGSGTFHQFGLYTLDRARLRPVGAALKKAYSR